jgi:hypothetical protein
MDRLKSLSKINRKELLSLQLAVRKQNWGEQPKVWMVLYRICPDGLKYLIASPPGYEEVLRKAFTTLPKDEHLFKFGGELSGGRIVFVGASGRVIIYKKTDS